MRGSLTIWQFTLMLFGVAIMLASQAWLRPHRFDAGRAARMPPPRQQSLIDRPATPQRSLAMIASNTAARV